MNSLSIDLFTDAIDLVAVLLLALGLKGLSKVRSARTANGLAALAMGLAVVGLLIQLQPSPITWLWIAVLRSGSHYRFTCPNYLFPYEPHFNIPTVFFKRLTARLWWKRIVGHPAAPNPEGLWQSLNWITVPAIARACRKLAGARAVFDTNILADALERVVFDPVFAARRPAWLRAIARGLVATRLHRLLALLPAFMQPIIDCQIERVGNLAHAAQGTSR